MTKYKFTTFVAIALMLIAVTSFVMLGGEAAGARHLGADGMPVWGTDIRVNAVAGSGLTARRNFSLAGNPLNPNNLIAAYDNQDSPQGSSGHAYSADAGRTWTGGYFTGLWVAEGYIPTGGGNVGFNAEGTGFYVGQALTDTLFGYFVLTTTNGVAWSQPRPVATMQTDQALYQPSLAVDGRASGPNAGSLYMAWQYTNNTPPYLQGIQVKYSRDGGQTWGNNVQVSDAGHEYSAGPSLAAATDGTLYAAFSQVDKFYIHNPHKLYLDRSTDGGATWGADRLITGAPIQQIGGPDVKKRELIVNGNAFCSSLRIHHFPSIAISPTDSNTVYAVWNDSRWESTISDCGVTGRHGDIAFSRSADGGATWSAPLRLNDDPMGNGIDQFLPTVQTRADGLIGVAWHDRRYSEDHFKYDVAYSQSTDGGLTWSPNRRVGDVSEDSAAVPDYKSIDYIGYRFSLLFGPDYVIPTWLGTRRPGGNGDFYVDRGVFPAATPTSVPPTATSTPIPPMPTPSFTPAAQQPSPTSTSVPPTSTRTATSTSTAVATATACSLQFTDVPQSNTFYPHVRCLACRGIDTGYPCGAPQEPCRPPANANRYFRPNALIARDDLAHMVAASAGFSEPPGIQRFQDVPASNPYYVWVQRMANRNLIGGYPCGGPGEPCVAPNNLAYYRPQANATRGQIAKIVSNGAGFEDAPQGQTFEDVSPSSTFYVWVQRLTRADRAVMGGYPCGGPGEPCGAGNRPYFRWGNNSTRGQVAKITANTFFPACSTP